MDGEPGKPAAAEVDVLIVHWNQGTACAASIEACAALPAVATIRVVDNGSRPEERRLVGAALERCPGPTELIGLDTNTGYGPGTNRGWEAWLADPAGTEWCLTLPHDIQPNPDTVAALLAEGNRRPATGLLCADVGDGALPAVDANFGPIPGHRTVTSGYEACAYPHGTMLLARRVCLERVGLYDERFFTYCEEADLGLRSAAAGWEVGIVWGAVVDNPRVSTPTDVAEYLMQRNTILLVHKHFGWFHAAVRFTLSVAQLIDRSVRRRRRSVYWSAAARRRALRDVLLRRWGPPPW